MSRAERRAYQRMTKNQDPYAPPAALSGAARARTERQRARRAASRQSSDPGRLLGARGAWIVVGGAAAVFLLAFSLAWGRGAQTALLIGAAAGIGWLALTLAFAWWRRRERLASARRGGPSGKG
jgi:hypothetical protein